MFRIIFKTIKLSLTAALLAGGMMAGFGATAQADPMSVITGTMCMVSGSCANNPLSGTIDYTDGGTLTFDANTFNGTPWTMSNTSVHMTPGNYSITNGTATLNYTVGAGQIGAQAHMNWGNIPGYTDMLVAFVWNYSDSGGVRTLTPGATGPGTNGGGVTMVNGFTGFTPVVSMTTNTPPSSQDTTPPTVSSTSPADGATGISPLVAGITVTFSEPMSPGSVTDAAITLDHGATVGTPTTSDDTTFVFPITSSPLAASTSYTVTFNAGPTDVAGNALTLPSPRTFTTGISAASAVNDSATAIGSTAVPVDVLANDTGYDASTVTVSTNPNHGTATVNTDGTITYTANAGFSGTDTFQYTVKDSGGHPSNAATVTVAVQAADPASSTGTLAPGDIANANGSTTGGGLTSDQVGVDSALSQQCVGGCFDFAVTGLNPGDAVTVVLPLTADIPANAVYRKLVGGTWQNFVTGGGDSIKSAGAVSSGVCPAAGSSSYTSGLTAGNRCVQLTITDGGLNDEDGTENGTVLDPGGVGVITAASSPSSDVGSSPSNSGGCSISTGRPKLTERGDWWLVLGFAVWLGLVIRRRQHRA
jgi:hypothetical protein